MDKDNSNTRLSLSTAPPVDYKPLLSLKQREMVESMMKLEKRPEIVAQRMVMDEVMRKGRVSLKEQRTLFRNSYCHIAISEKINEENLKHEGLTGKELLCMMIDYAEKKCLGDRRCIKSLISFYFNILEIKVPKDYKDKFAHLDDEQIKPAKLAEVHNHFEAGSNSQVFNAAVTGNFDKGE